MYEYQTGTIESAKRIIESQLDKKIELATLIDGRFRKLYELKDIIIGSLVDAGHHEIAKIVERRMEEFKGEME